MRIKEHHISIPSLYTSRAVAGSSVVVEESFSLLCCNSPNIRCSRPRNCESFGNSEVRAVIRAKSGVNADARSGQDVKYPAWCCSRDRNHLS